MSKRFRGMGFAASLLVTVQVTFGQGVGPGGPFETTYTVEAGGTIPQSSAVGVASAGLIGAPISVELDPAGLPWIKHFALPSGGYLTSGQGIAFSQYLLVSGQRSWSGWREDILTPGFTWCIGPGWGFGLVGALLPGVTADWAPVGSPPGTAVAFSFPEVAPGAEISASMVLVYSGSSPFTGEITTRSYPTPEPGTCVLLTLGVALMPGRGRRGGAR